MGHYSDVVHKFNDTGLKFGEVAVAIELAAFDMIDQDSEDFETACDYLYDYYISTDIGAAELAGLLVAALQAKQATLEDLKKNPKLVDEAIENLM